MGRKLRELTIKDDFSVILNLGEIPEPIRERITSVSEQETLTDWAKIAVQSASMEEFVKKISE